MATPNFQTSPKNMKAVNLKQRPYVGYVAWLVQRITAILLLVLLPLKIYSGYVIIGKLPGSGILTTLHINAFLDAFLIFALIFHSLYGVRVILIDIGVVKDNRGIFKLFTIIGATLCALSFFFLVM
jgi:succinate dehydrogenase/fumarate reductase cytochrome b subunit